MPLSPLRRCQEPGLVGWGGECTILVCRDILSRQRILLVHLVLQVLFSLVQHLQLPAQL